MIKALLLTGALVFAGITIGGAKAYVDSQAGPGTFNAAVDYGTSSGAEFFGEVARAPGKQAQQLTPAFNDLRSVTGSALGGVGAAATQGWDDPTATTVPGARP